MSDDKDKLKARTAGEMSVVIDVDSHDPLENFSFPSPLNRSAYLGSTSLFYFQAHSLVSKDMVSKEIVVYRRMYLLGTGLASKVYLGCYQKNVHWRCLGLL